MPAFISRTAARLGATRADCILILIGIIAIIPMTVFAVRSYIRRDNARVAVREATERVAVAILRGDSTALSNDPLLAGHPETVTRLLQHRDAIIDRYWVRVCENSRGDRLLEPADVITHLGLIRTYSGEVRLGFRYVHETDQLDLVTDSFSPTD